MVASLLRSVHYHERPRPRALRRRLGWRRVVVDVSLLGVIALLILAAVVVAVGQRGVIVGMRVPRGPVLVIVAEATSVVVADVPMVVAMRGRRVGVLGFL